MKLITNPDRRKSYNCYSGGICYLLERKGIFLSEHMSFGLSAGLNFMIEVNSKISFYAVRELHCLTNFIESLGVRVIENLIKDPEQTILLIKKSINNDMPLMVEYDGFYFPFTQIYNRKHEKRIGMVVGYDDQNIYFSDFIYGVYEVPLSYEVFNQARSQDLGACVEPKWYDVFFEDDINLKITPELVKSVLIDVSNHFLAKHGSNASMMIGIEGMEIFSYEVGNIVSQQKSKTINVDWIEFSEDLKQIVITLNHYGNFISDISKKNLIYIDVQKANKLTELLNKASDTWRIICNLFFKLGMTGKDTLSEKISLNIRKSAELLTEAFLIIQNVLIN